MVWKVAPLSLLGGIFGHIIAQATDAPIPWSSLLAPLGSAMPFAGLALYIIRRQEQVVDKLTEELRRVNDETINKFVTAINDATSLHRESTRMWEQVLNELRNRWKT